VFFGADPDAPCNRDIVDLDLAPREGDGLVHFSSDFALLQPADATRDTGRLLVEVSNRGQERILSSFNGTARQTLGTEPDPGNGFLLREGYAIAWCGWQHDVPNPGQRLAMYPPEARLNGQPLRGRVHVDFQPSRGVLSQILSDQEHRPYPTADLDDPEAVLTVREHVEAPRQVIPRDRWRFARVEGNAVVPDPGHVYLAERFEPGRIYELVYTAQGAPVVGLGLLAIRDVVSWLRHGDAATGNPRAGRDRYAYGYGRSQSGRFLRQFLYTGLNADEQGRVVFDGILDVVAGARQGEFNMRFGQPSRILIEGVGASFPFHEVAQTDPVTGQTDGLLNLVAVRGVVPKIVAMNTSAEYWGGARGSGGQASLQHTDPAGTHHVEPTETSRHYLLAGTMHFPAEPANLGQEEVNSSGVRAPQPINSVDYGPLLKAMLVNLDRWVREDVPPPPNAVPRLTDGTAVRPEEALAFFERLPGVQLPARLPRLRRLDFGPAPAPGILDNPRPTLGEPYPHYVSALDENGNELGGVRHPDLDVPLATYAGWNVRHPDSGAPGELTSAGLTLPFSGTEAERQAADDPRPSIAARYASKEAYLEQVRQAARRLVQGRWMLEEDVEPVVERAGRRWDLFTGRGEA
jgi:hypothetical protein